jgi:hypothetical protein
MAACRNARCRRWLGRATTWLEVREGAAWAAPCTVEDPRRRACAVRSCSRGVDGHRRDDRVESARGRGAGASVRSWLADCSIALLSPVDAPRARRRAMERRRSLRPHAEPSAGRFGPQWRARRRPSRRCRGRGARRPRGRDRAEPRPPGPRTLGAGIADGGGRPLGCGHALTRRTRRSYVSALDPTRAGSPPSDQGRATWWNATRAKGASKRRRRSDRDKSLKTGQDRSRRPARRRTPSTRARQGQGRSAQG